MQQDAVKGTRGVGASGSWNSPRLVPKYCTRSSSEGLCGELCVAGGPEVLPAVKRLGAVVCQKSGASTGTDTPPALHVLR